MFCLWLLVIWYLVCLFCALRVLAVTSCLVCYTLVTVVCLLLLCCDRFGVVVRSMVGALTLVVVWCCC